MIYVNNSKRKMTTIWKTVYAHKLAQQRKKKKTKYVYHIF